MKKLIIKMSSMLLLAPDIEPILRPILDAFNAVLFPILMGVLSVIAVITFADKAIKLMKSEDENQKVAAMKSIKTAIFAFIAIFVLLIGVRLALPILEDWVKSVS